MYMQRLCIYLCTCMKCTNIVVSSLSLSLCPSGSVKKCGLLKILHEKFPQSKGRQKQSCESREFHETILEVAHGNKDMLPHIGKAQEILNPLRVLYLFKSIPDEVGGGALVWLL